MKLICVGDLHLRERTPRARTDDYFQAQEKKLDWLFDLRKEENAVILQAGDFFHSSPPSDFLKRWFIEKRIEDERCTVNELCICTVYGQHDLVHHSLKRLNRTGLSVLEAAGVVDIIDNEDELEIDDGVRLTGCHWGQEVPRYRKNKEITRILLIHKMIIKDKLWPGQNAIYGKDFLKEHDEYSIIVSGDNHQAFMFEVNGRYLYNPGSLMRMTAAQFDHEPQIGIYDTDTRELEIVKVPCEPSEKVLSREHLEEVEERNERLEAFISTLREDYEISLNFRDNLQEHFEVNKTREEVRDLIMENLTKKGGKENGAVNN